MLQAWIQPIVAQYGLYAVFVIVMLESAGLPLPGETALVLAAIFAGMTGQIDIVHVIAVAAAGAIIGDNIGFMVGRRYGLPLVKRYGAMVGLDEKRLAFGQHMFARHGAKIVFFGRFVAILRIFAALLAGVNHYGWRQFLFYNAAGGIVWATVFGVAGYVFGDAVHRVAGRSSHRSSSQDAALEPSAMRCRRNAFPMTETDENAMASAAIRGESSRPNAG